MSADPGARAARAQGEQRLARLREAGVELGALDEAQLVLALAQSEFLEEALAREPSLGGELGSARERDYARECRALLENAADESAYMSALRRLRRRVLARIAWRDLAGLAPLEETLESLSAFADAAIAVSCRYAEGVLARRYGSARGAAGAPQELVVIAMGKLGGRELNFSSDVDLVFLYPEAGESDGAAALDNGEFYTRVGQKLIQLLGARTVDGIVFRVDLRLRPFGDSGPPVSSFAALEDYLQAHGRDWERYAWIKARAVTGAATYANLFRDVVRPFVYRRYLDFGVLASLRSMKALIEREVERRDLADNVKLGSGGIREIEFIVQTLQLLRGGSEPKLRAAALLEVLPRLAGHKLLPPLTVDGLLRAYHFLRMLENRLQLRRDEQVHSLPKDPEARAALAASLHFDSWDALEAAIRDARAVVAGHFRALMDAPRGDTPGYVGALFAPSTTVASLVPLLPRAASDSAEALALELLDLSGSAYYRRLDSTGQGRLQALIAPLLAAALARPEPVPVLKRAFSVVHAIGTRTAYLALLVENPLALERLVELCALGPFLAAQIASYPLLLDELIDARLFDEPPSRALFARDLAIRREAFDAADEPDPEREIEVLRKFQRAALFRTALFDLSGQLPLMQVSDRLTDIAELILGECMRFAWREVTAVHGAPLAGSAGAPRECAVAAVGYGKLGGHELGYGSDLDLVFLHDSGGELHETRGPKVIDNGVFFLRLGQKILHLLTVHSAAGRLYEVDTRLRPSGKGGFLVTNVAAFAEYQEREAWTWEHQALLHSRAVAGDARLCAEFERVRTEVLVHHVRRERLAAEVRAMRERMRRELAGGSEERFDLKQDRGGTADIEFLAQYWVLAHADRHPPLVLFADTIRQLESVASAALVAQAEVDELVGAYREYRLLLHRASLEGLPALVPAAPLAARRERVSAIWERHLGGGEPV
jgi:[glutamine synthetase] adenylyltransferase / [glutamine synthetase]-adenylyl-L-tyrosine phosphorylase